MKRFIFTAPDQGGYPGATRELLIRGEERGYVSVLLSVRLGRDTKCSIEHVLSNVDARELRDMLTTWLEQ